jgi:hypothetical protein
VCNHHRYEDVDVFYRAGIFRKRLKTGLRRQMKRSLSSERYGKQVAPLNFLKNRFADEVLISDFVSCSRIAA